MSSRQINVITHNSDNTEQCNNKKEFFQQTLYSPGLLTHSAVLFFVVNILFFSICGRLDWLYKTCSILVSVAKKYCCAVSG